MRCEAAPEVHASKLPPVPVDFKSMCMILLCFEPRINTLSVFYCMQDLMRGISQRSTITPQNWTMYLSERLKQKWRMSREWDPPPFSPRRNREAMEYSVLPLIDRCGGSHALRRLSECKC